jgi:hypothetical protein
MSSKACLLRALTLRDPRTNGFLIHHTSFLHLAISDLCKWYLITLESFSNPLNTNPLNANTSINTNTNTKSRMENSSNNTNESPNIQNMQNTNTHANTPNSLSKLFHSIKDKEKERETDKEGEDRDRITPTRSASLALTKASHFLAQKSASIPRRFSLMGSAPFSADISASPSSAPFHPHHDVDSGVSPIGGCVFYQPHEYLYLHLY